MEIHDETVKVPESSLCNHFEYLPKLSIKSGFLAEAVAVLGVLQPDCTLTLLVFTACLARN